MKIKRPLKNEQGLFARIPVQISHKKCHSEKYGMVLFQNDKITENFYVVFVEKKSIPTWSPIMPY